MVRFLTAPPRVGAPGGQAGQGVQGMHSVGAAGRYTRCPIVVHRFCSKERRACAFLF
jgi:hypothetical protein